MAEFASSIDVYPREGQTYPDAAGVPITATGATVDRSKYILEALRDSFLLTEDPLDVYQPENRTTGGVIVGGRTFNSFATLGASLGLLPGEACELLGYSAAGDGGGGTFYWSLGDSTPANGGTIAGSSFLGRWRRLMDDNTVNVRWFGAKGNGTGDDTAAIHAAMDFAMANSIRNIYLPPGTYRASSITHFKSDMRFYGAGRTQTIIQSTATTTTGGEKGLLEITGTAFLNQLEISDLYLDCTYDQWDANTVSVPQANQIHGIYIHGQTSTLSLTLRGMRMYGTSGYGIRCTSGEVFQSVFEDIDFSLCVQGHMYVLRSSICNRYTGLTFGALSSGKSCLTIVSGGINANGCNGIFQVGYLQGTYPAKCRFATLGSASTFVLANWENCNIESFTEYGIYHFADSSSNFRLTSFTCGTMGGAVRALYYERVQSDSVQYMDSSCRFFTTGTATWGDPDTNVTDTYAVECLVGTPFFSYNAINRYSMVTPVGSAEIPVFKNVTSAFRTPGLQISNEQPETLFHTTVIKSATFTADTSSEYLCNATSGAITANLPQAAYSTGRRLTFVKTDASGNAVTLDGYIGETINGATTRALTAQWNKVTVLCDGSRWVEVT